MIDFLVLALGVEKAEAMRQFLSMVSGGHVMTESIPARPAPRGLALPALRRPTPEEIEAIAVMRHIDPAAVDCAVRLSLLRMGTVHGQTCWILLDDSLKVAEARRLDGRIFPAVGTLSERKAHTIKGSSKAWPVGTAVLRKRPGFRAIIMVEGGPDVLAGLHYALDAADVLPVAMLGRSVGGRIDPEALNLLKGRRIRICPHDDPDGGGMASAKRWADQLHVNGCEVDYFTFSGLTRRDGVPAKDLNDTTVLADADMAKLSDLLP